MPLLGFLSGVVKGGKRSQENPFDFPAERVIAQGRLILCAAFLLAIHIDPEHPVREWTAGYGLLLGYVAFAVALIAGQVWRLPGRAVGLLIHVADIAIFTVLLYLSDGRGHPFFATFGLFALLAAALRWTWRAVLITTGLLGVILLGTRLIWTPNSVALAAAGARTIYLLASGGLVAFVSALRERRRDLMMALANPPIPRSPQRSALDLENLLAHCATALEVPRLLVLWQVEEEPAVNIAMWQENRYQQTSEPAGTFGHFIRSERYANRAFGTDDATSGFIITHDGPIKLKAPIIDDGLVRMFRMRGVATAAFEGVLCRGRAFMLDRQSWGDFQLLVTQVLAFQIANELDRQIMQTRAEETAAAVERDKLSRDLHDGILQDLAALDLQLALLGNSRGNEAAQRLDTMKHLVQQEQRRLREFVRASSRTTASPASIALGRELQRIIAHAARQWGCATSLSGQPQDAVVPARLGSHLSFLVSEAIANAVRHGRASSIRVGFCRTAEDLQLEIADNGGGFNGAAFDCDEKELAASGTRPVSLRERVRELGGCMRVRSSGAGVEIKIRLPLT